MKCNKQRTLSSRAINFKMADIFYTLEMFIINYVNFFHSLFFKLLFLLVVVAVIFEIREKILFCSRTTTKEMRCIISI